MNIKTEGGGKDSTLTIVDDVSGKGGTYLKAEGDVNILAVDENYLEWSEKGNKKGYFPYKHRNLRGAYASLKYYMNYLFTFEKHAELNIENTTNRLEGLFKYLKR